MSPLMDELIFPVNVRSNLHTSIHGSKPTEAEVCGLTNTNVLPIKGVQITVLNDMVYFG